MQRLFNLELTEQEIKIVFEALLDRPFREVAALVAKVQAVYRTTQDATKEVQHGQE